jgi:hypothetical protein
MCREIIGYLSGFVFYGDFELELLASKYKIREYGFSNGDISRKIIIEGLYKPMQLWILVLSCIIQVIFKYT